MTDMDETERYLDVSQENSCLRQRVDELTASLAKTQEERDEFKQYWMACLDQAAQQDKELCVLTDAIAAAREDVRRLDWLLSFASVEDVGDEHVVPGVVFRIEDAESELFGPSLDWTPRQFIDAAMERVAAPIPAPARQEEP
jgi:hypothetical protein